MKFNHELEGLDNNNRLSLNEIEITVKEFRYALDQAFLNEVSDILIQSLKTYGVFIETSDSADWLRQGLKSSVFKSGTQIGQIGRLKLKISLEFCPDRVEKVNKPGEIPGVEALELEIKAEDYSPTPLPIPCITLIRSSNGS